MPVDGWLERTGTHRAVGGRRASEPPTGAIPVITAPLLDEHGGGRRIRPTAPVSAAPETGARQVIRSFDHTGEIPAVQVTLPPREQHAPTAPTTAGPAPGPASGRAVDVDLPPAWAPAVEPVTTRWELPSTTDLAEAVLAGQVAAATGSPVEQPEESVSEKLARREQRSRRTRDSFAARRAERLAGSAFAGRPVAEAEAAAAVADLAADVPADVTADVAADVPAGLAAQLPAVLPDDPSATTVVPALPPRERSRSRASVVRAVTPASEDARTAARPRFLAWCGVLAVGVLLLALAALHVGPTWFDGVGAVAVLTSFCWTAAARSGGRPVIFSGLGAAIGVAALLVDGSVLRSGAAVMTCVVSGVLAVLLTVPARTVLGAVREVAVATAVASVGAFATIGFEPVASTSRFELITLLIGMCAMVVLIWRFAAGLHGLGTRGLVIVVAGTALLVLSQVYTELLRNYGSAETFGPGTDLGGWLHDTFGATPRTTIVFLGVPALLYGIHMRARRRQGWWFCTFGAVATLPVAQRLVNLETSYVEAGLQTFYSVALGCLVGFALIRLDQRLSGTHGARARALEEDGALRPEPRRFAPL